MFKWANPENYANFEKSITSPGEKLKLTFRLIRGAAYYEVSKDSQDIINKSQLGFLFFGEKPLGRNLKVRTVLTDDHTETIELPWGDVREIENNYRELSLELVENTNPHRNLTLRFRVFNDSVAFRYELPERDKIKNLSVREELTEFNLDQSSKMYFTPAHQKDRYEYSYETAYPSAVKSSAVTPATFALPNGFFVAIHEAALYNYGAMNLKNESAHLISDITPLSDGSKAHIKLPFSTPWRLIMVADSALDLTKNHAMYALNPTPKSDFSWVKTLKFLGIWWAMYVGEYTWAPDQNHGATTKNAKKYIDYCVKLGIQGLLIEGWNNGWEGDWLENGATTDFLSAMSDFDLEKIANYAKDNDIDLIGHHETVGFVDNYARQLEPAYNLYVRNGIRYLKTGYSGAKMKIHGREEYHQSQAGVNHYQKTLELAAKKHICLDIHEPIKGTGLERTYPNLLTREGARGQEYEGGAISPSHACFLPFTRLLAGGMDYTPGIFDLNNPKRPVHTTLARQLAYFVTIYSGMLMAADRPEIYEKYPDLFEFIQHVPTSFEKSVPLIGEIGQYFAIARKDRDSENWYLGAVTDESARELTIDLSFLSEGQKYRAIIYEDTKDAHYLTNKLAYEIIKKTVTSKDVLILHLAPGGGCAIEFVV